MKKFNPLMLIPGMGAWAVIGAGAATKNDTLIGIGVVMMVGGILVGLVIKYRRWTAERDDMGRIWKGGKPGRAKIVDIKHTGASVNRNPRIDFELDVTPEGQPAYRAQASVLVSLIAIPRVQPGCEIEVRIDPQDGSKVVIDEKLTYLGYAAA